MAKLISLMIESLDGYIADRDGRFEWAAPDEEVHAFANDLMRPIATHLYGRRMWEVMRYWETAHTLPDQTEVELDFARVWQAADKVVYSTTLEAVSTARTRLERAFDADAVSRLKEATAADITVAGPGLAGQALRAGLVDELHVLVSPAVVGGGLRSLPDGLRLDLELLDERRFTGGVVHLHYRIAS